MLTDNKIFLQQNYPSIYEKLNKEFANKEEIISLEETKDGNQTIKVQKDERSIYLHSKYNPIREAETIIDKLIGNESIDENSYVIFYGLGLGYHIEEFTKKCPDVEFSLYEPSTEIFSRFLDRVNLKELSKKRLDQLNCENDQGAVGKYMRSILKRIEKKVVIYPLPIYEDFFGESYGNFLEVFKIIVMSNRSNLHTELAHQKRWTINSVKNFKYVLSTSNILVEKAGAFKNKPAILVSAGPSLNEEIENLRYIKENGLAYIFSVGSAINTLIHQNIYPDMATILDPSIENQKVYSKVIDLNIKDIPLMFSTSCVNEVVSDYTGELYHIIGSQDKVAPFFLRAKDETKVTMAYDVVSVALTAFQFLFNSGFNPIILAGQNLAFLGQKRHSDGVTYSPNLTEAEEIEKLTVKDVYGQDIITDRGYLTMKDQFEKFIEVIKDIQVINTTKGGAHIEGTKFIELKTVMDTMLKDKVVEDNWLDGKLDIYDKEYLALRIRTMDRSKKKALDITKDYGNTLNKIEKAIDSRNFSNAEKLYIKLDKNLRDIEKNEYYSTFILPMNEVKYKILIDSIDTLNQIKNPHEKGQRIVRDFKSLIDLCIEDIEMLEPIYEEMKENINKYIYTQES